MFFDAALVAGLRSTVQGMTCLHVCCWMFFDASLVAGLRSTVRGRALRLSWILQRPGIVLFA
eukprot:2086628-Rhodomonas_salina.1